MGPCMVGGKIAEGTCDYCLPRSVLGQISFVANTVIDSVEMAVDILIRRWASTLFLPAFRAVNLANFFVRSLVKRTPNKG